MERDNQKEKRISIEEAKSCIRKFWKNATADGKRYVWLGDDVEEYKRGYLIPASLPKVGVVKPESYIRAWVDYTTGEVSMAFDLTA